MPSLNRWTVVDELFAIAELLNHHWWAIHRRRIIADEPFTVTVKPFTYSVKKRETQNKKALNRRWWAIHCRHCWWSVAEPSPLLMIRRWWIVANKPLTIADKPTLHLQIAGNASPCLHRQRFSFIGDALKCYFNSHRCRFATHSSPIRDPFVADSWRFWSVILAHSSPIQTLRDEVFTVDVNHSRRSRIGKVFFSFSFSFSFSSCLFCLSSLPLFFFFCVELANTLLSSYLKLMGECVLCLFKNCIVVLFLKIYDFVFCDSYLGTDPLEMRFLRCLVVVFYQVFHLVFLLIFNIFAFVFSTFLWLWWVLLAKSY